MQQTPLQVFCFCFNIDNPCSAAVETDRQRCNAQVKLPAFLCCSYVIGEKSLFTYTANAIVDLHPVAVKVPASVALPFGSFERTLKDKANAGAAKPIAGLQKQLVSRPGMRCSCPSKLS